MYTLYDFMTHIKGVEYILALTFIAGYILISEALKARPFATLKEGGKEDLEHIRQEGYRSTLRTVGKIASAPFIGIAYIVALPAAFFVALAEVVVNGVIGMVGKSASFEWRPTEAYLAGKKKKKEEKKKEVEK